MLNKSEECVHPCCSWLKRKLFQVFLIKYDVGIVLSYMAFIILRYIACIPGFIRAFYYEMMLNFIEGFLHLVRRPSGFCLCFCSYAVLHLMICIYWTIPASLEWCWLVMVYDLFDILWNLICQYILTFFVSMFIKKDWPIILFFFVLSLSSFEMSILLAL
jgi:hypothetical protein